MRVESGGKFGRVLAQSVLRFKIPSRLHFDPSKHTFQDAHLARTYFLLYVQFSSVQSLSRVQLFATP